MWFMHVLYIIYDTRVLYDATLSHPDYLAKGMS